MAEPVNRTQFKDYILRRLGYPVQQINIDDEQVEDRIDDALSYFREYHFDGAERVFLKHLVTTQDLENGYITVPEIVVGVIRCLPLYGSGGSSSNLFNVRYQLSLDLLFNLSSTSLIPYHTAMTRLNDIQEMFDATPSIRYQKHKDRIEIADWQTIPAGTWLIFEAERYLDPSEYTDVWSDRWFKQYATALVKKQWGENVKTFAGVQLLGGITIDGKTIFDEAVEEVRMLEEKMITSYSRPLLDRIG